MPLAAVREVYANSSQYGPGKATDYYGSGGKFILKVPANQVLSWAVKAPGFVEQRKRLNYNPEIIIS